MTEEDATEKIVPLPECNGSNGIEKVDCKKSKPMPMCAGNKPPKKQEGVEATCRVLPECDAQNDKVVPPNCYRAGQMKSLAQ
jgi:hypothetical protein